MSLAKKIGIVQANYIPSLVMLLVFMPT